MILAVPFIALSLFGTNFMGMVIWALIFADCFARRRALVAAGPGVMDEEISYDYMNSPSPRRKQSNKRFVSAARKRARLEQAEQVRIDAILAKVKEKGLHSLTWGKNAPCGKPRPGNANEISPNAIDALIDSRIAATHHERSGLPFRLNAFGGGA